MKKFQALLLTFAVSFAACTSVETPLSSTDQAMEVEIGTEYEEPPTDPTPPPPTGEEPPTVEEEPTMDTEYVGLFDFDPVKTANCTANFAGLTGMAVAAAAAVVLAGAVIAEIAAGAGAGTAIATAWADVVAIVGSITTAADIGAAAALLIERFATFRNVLVGIGGTAAALGITQAAKDALDGALKVLEDYGTGWSNYWKCCVNNDNTACGNMPFNVL
jgi:hypothetical protein